jgi:hypothetical protein
MVSRKPGIDDIRMALECVISAGKAASRKLAHARVLRLADAVLAPMTLPIKIKIVGPLARTAPRHRRRRGLLSLLNESGRDS